MKIDELEAELVANYIEEYLGKLEYLCDNIRTLYPIYKMDEDDEIAKIEATMEMLRAKIEGIRKAKDIRALKELLHLKKVIKESLNKGGNFYAK